MDVCNANNPNYVPEYTTWRGYTHRNTNGLTQQELQERILRREVAGRVDPSGSLMASHLADVQRIGGGRVSNMLNNIQTSASQTMQNQHLTAIRDLMSQEEEGSLRMNILQRMLEDATRPANISLNGNGNLNLMI
ncbi:MAG: hypothetical protein FWB80_11215 [Defluviitaleaceae bacterium]|nr:hypothetical protein [Defluviitaleaceae bacterium]